MVMSVLSPHSMSSRNVVDEADRCAAHQADVKHLVNLDSDHGSECD